MLSGQRSNCRGIRVIVWAPSCIIIRRVTVSVLCIMLMVSFILAVTVALSLTVVKHSICILGLMMLSFSAGCSRCWGAHFVFYVRTLLWVTRHILLVGRCLRVRILLGRRCRVHLPRSIIWLRTLLILLHALDRGSGWSRRWSCRH
jgi:hypothetical protein